VSIETIGSRAMGFAGRMRGYFREMLPLPQHAALALLMYAGVAMFARHAHGLATPLVSWHGVVGVASTLGLMVILRLMDELKDADIDRRLFPERPLPSGRVLRSDIRWTLGGVAALYFGMHLPLGWASLSSVFVLAYAFLMFHRFFAPDLLRRSLPVTLATHNPIVPLMILHAFAVFAAEHSLAPDEVHWGRVAPFVGMAWGAFLAWEIARKIRCREEEDDYVTYSRLLGRRGAVLATWFAQATSVALGIHLARAWNHPGAAVALIGVGFGVNLWAGARYLRRPNSRTSRLKPFAIIFVAAVLLFPIVGLVAR
jgi:4-hydroxybenzoate polyprenyltransferase